MAQVLRHLTPPDRPELLVDLSSGDDAAVWQIDEHRALVMTIDVLTPVVDDPRTWGRVAAANAVSDIYAMGARPLVALNYAAWPRDELPLEMLADVLGGGRDVADEDGFVVVGGHSIDGPEPTYGLAVLGEVDPARMLTNAGLRPGQAIVLTKPLGIGIITTAIKRGVATTAQVDAALAQMTTTNRLAAAAAVELGVTGATDVTGFGLFGHLGRMARESGVDIDLDVAAVPLLDGVTDLAARGVVPGGAERNLDWASGFVDAGDADPSTRMILADPQTSGGLIMGVDVDRVDALIDGLAGDCRSAVRVGTVSVGRGTIRLR